MSEQQFSAEWCRAAAQEIERLRAEATILSALRDKFDVMENENRLLRDKINRLRVGCNPECPGCELRPCNERGEAVLWCDECVQRLRAALTVYADEENWEFYIDVDGKIRYYWDDQTVTLPTRVANEALKHV